MAAVDTKIEKAEAEAHEIKVAEAQAAAAAAKKKQQAELDLSSAVDALKAAKAAVDANPGDDSLKNAVIAAEAKVNAMQEILDKLSEEEAAAVGKANEVVNAADVALAAERKSAQEAAALAKEQEEAKKKAEAEAEEEAEAKAEEEAAEARSAARKAAKERSATPEVEEAEETAPVAPPRVSDGRMYYLAEAPTLDALMTEVNNKIEEGYYIYHGVQRGPNGYIQALVLLPQQFGEEVWRVFHTVDKLFVSTELEKQTALANDAVPLVLKNLGANEEEDEETGHLGPDGIDLLVHKFKESEVDAAEDLG